MNAKAKLKEILELAKRDVTRSHQVFLHKEVELARAELEYNQHVEFFEIIREAYGKMD